ncbi:MAG: hypothetical protein CM1200mP18_14500 [Gammaproteobacteria bacterium]|nr:MAG: hypothetical protein CM1200mP18_14500 [Gammaproteobacteria bacterium]
MSSVKITRIETFSREYLAFVKVTTEDGASAGVRSPLQCDITARIVHRQIAPWVLGKPCPGHPNTGGSHSAQRAQVSRLLSAPGIGGLIPHCGT